MNWIPTIKKPAFMLFASLVAIVGTGEQTVYAETRYVTDMLYIKVREGRGTGANVETLRSDSPVKVIEEDGRFIRVHTQAGNEGWVARQYIATKTPKSRIIKELKDEVTRLKTSINNLEDTSRNLSELIAENELLKKKNYNLRMDVQKLRKKNRLPRPPAMFWWFLAGGAVFLCGLCIGSISKKKKYYIDALR